MPYLKLIHARTQQVFELRESVVRLGRDRASTIPFTGEDARIVSSNHAELRHAAGPSGEFTVVDREGRVIFPPGEPDLSRRGWGFAGFAGLSSIRRPTTRVQYPCRPSSRTD